jgi:hypothetical protein
MVPSKSRAGVAVTTAGVGSPVAGSTLATTAPSAIDSIGTASAGAAVRTNWTN